MKFNSHPPDIRGFMRPERKKWKTLKKWRKTRKHYEKSKFTFCHLNAAVRRTVQAFERFGVAIEKAARAIVRNADKQNKRNEQDATDSR